MQEYLDNGAQLGWLIDPYERIVYIYRLGREPECLENPSSLHGEDLLPGLTYAVHQLWA
jgi:Uma2 family endonuclease